jgi:polar amino acid transport system substrate-binding protein
MLKKVFIGALLCLLQLSGNCALEPVRLVTRDQEPYGSFKDDKTFDGIAVRVVDCVFKRLNRPYQIKVYPWERAQMVAEKGEADGMFPAAMTPDRLMWSEGSDRIAGQRWVWLLPWDSKLDPNSDEFKITARVGAFFGSKRLKTLELGRYNVVLRPQSELQLLKAFMMGRADAILVGDMAAAEAMKTLNLNPNQFRTVFAQDRPMHVFFTKKFLQNEPEFLKQFNAQIPGCQ